jgi:hypothetical protein
MLSYDKERRLFRLHVHGCVSFFVLEQQQIDIVKRQRQILAFQLPNNKQTQVITIKAPR